MRLISFIIVIALSLFGTVSAISGVSPGSYEVSFLSEINQDYSFNFIFDAGTSSEIYVSGPLSEYVTLDKDTIYGSEVVTATLNLGDEALKFPGLNKIRVGAREISEDGDLGVGITSDVGGIIKVRVPYPGEFADLEVFVADANVGEDINVILRVINRGIEAIVIKPQVQIFYGDNKVDGVRFKETRLLSGESLEFNEFINTSNYSSGEYVATGLGEYGDKVARVDDPFKMGEFYVEITNYDDIFDAKELQKFEIGVEGFWNGAMENLHAEVTFEDYPDASFQTPGITLGAFETGQLTGFFNANLIDEDLVDARITIYYGVSSTEKNIQIQVDQGINWSLIIFAVIFAVIFAAIILRIILFKKRYKILKR